MSFRYYYYSTLSAHIQLKLAKYSILSHNYVLAINDYEANCKPFVSHD